MNTTAAAILFSDILIVLITFTHVMLLSYTITDLAEAAQSTLMKATSVSENLSTM